MLWAKQSGLVPTKLVLAEHYKTEVPSMAGFTDAVANARARTGKLGPKWPDTAKVIYTECSSYSPVRRLRATQWLKLAPVSDRGGTERSRRMSDAETLTTATEPTTPPSDPTPASTRGRRGEEIAKILLSASCSRCFHKNFPLNGILRALFLLPWLLPLIVGSAAWRAILEQNSGILNVTLEKLGIIHAPIPWLASPDVR